MRIERRLTDLREDRVVVGDIGFERFEQDAIGVEHHKLDHDAEYFP